MSAKKPSRKTVERSIWSSSHWSVKPGVLRKGVGHPGKVANLFQMVAEKLPYDSLPIVRKHVETNIGHVMGVYIAATRMGCPRYPGNIFDHLKARKKSQNHELAYFSFYVFQDKKHEREIEPKSCKPSRWPATRRGWGHPRSSPR